MPVTAVRLQPVSKAVPVPGSATLTFTARSTGAEDASVVVLYSVMDGAAVRISGGGQASPTIGGSSTTVSQRVDFDRTENPTPLAFRVRAVVTENGVEQFERIWPIRVDSTAMAEAILESGGTLEPEGQGAPRAKRKSAAKKSTARKGGAKKAAGKKAAGKKAAAKRKSAGKKSTAKKAGAKKSTAKKAGAKKAGARKAATKKSAKRATKKAATKKSAAKKSAGKRSAAKRR